MPSGSQQWSLVLDFGQIRSKRGACIESTPFGGAVNLKPCDKDSVAQRWDIDSATGQIRSHFGNCLDGGAQLVRCSPEAPAHPKASRRNVDKAPARQQWSLWDIQELPGHSLFCFSLCVPWTSEPDLLLMQLTNRISIFSCEEFTVYSHPVISLGDFKTRLLKMDLHVPRCGKYETICNTPVFQKLWQQLVEDRQFARHDWTVKVDPDAVFLPDRLRGSLRDLDEELAHSPKGIFLNNCKLGLHGPIEVISRRALEVFAASMDRSCGYAPQEDVYLQGCMKSLGVKQVDRFDSLLAEQECARDGWKQDPDWMKCASSKAAFHPFKNPDEYQACLGRAKPGFFGNTSIG
jgi:hypothetical protein